MDIKPVREEISYAQFKTEEITVTFSFKTGHMNSLQKNLILLGDGGGIVE